MVGHDAKISEKIHVISDNVPQVEVEGPFENHLHIYITDSDGDVIGLKPGEARRLQKKLTAALHLIATKRPAKYGHFKKVGK